MGRGGRSGGWVRSQTPPKHFSPDPDPEPVRRSTARCLQCDLPRDDSEDRCSYCRKAVECADFMNEHLPSNQRMVSWQVVWLSRWLRHSEQTGDTPRT